MTPPRRILLLGGTGEARRLAELLDKKPEFEVVYSLAGRVENPVVPTGTVRSGGFGGVIGLRHWMSDNHIDEVVDATHPFAATISDHAVSACKDTDIPLTVLRRPPWLPVPGDRWQNVPTMDAAALALDALPDPSTVFLTTGRQDVETFAGIARHRFVIRAIDPPTGPTPASSTVVLARGPFDLDDELDLMRRQSVDILVTKNSGGDMTYAKLVAARRRNIPVIVVERPPSIPTTEFVTATAVLNHLMRTDAT
ncbi:precorrin-6A reductase [Rhodococcoides trifolii]|uniref:Precorrin-6A reductase n=1 Tax=Rhodococcoides trifolii TaxID=908250 RepID=A0A917D650_9NOCA|nr:cobalt-precorrin-6A reductase [Rhodococcus trifolii]GGG10273.1 precorrin-6A reductase [Rhodococcus trifolii]